jgi:hypothetical protein
MTSVRLAGVMSAWLAATALLCSCSDLAQREDAERARYHSYAGAPVDHFTWLGRYEGWQSLGKDELVLWTTPWDAYLIRVTPPCIDLPFVNGIGVTSTARTVSAHFDFVLVRSQGGERGAAVPWRCPIAEIRPVDYRRMRKEMREHAPLPGAPAAPAQVQGSSSAS